MFLFTKLRTKNK